jgi:hypothetical protein
MNRYVLCVPVTKVGTRKDGEFHAWLLRGDEE